MTEEQGRTCLHLLAEMPSAFKSGYAMLKYSIRKIYCCMFDATFSFPFLYFI
jgi:hypothetical protein